MRASVILAILAMIGFAAYTQGAILAVDIGPAGQTVAAGFVGLSGAGGPVMSGVYGPYTVTITPGDEAQPPHTNPRLATRAKTPPEAAFNADLLRDFVRAEEDPNGNGNPGWETARPYLTLEIQGLAPTTAYNLTLWSWVATGQATFPAPGITYHVEPIAGTTGAAGGYNWDDSQLVNPWDKSYLIEFTTNAAGTMTVHMGITANPCCDPQVVLNGFVVDNIPEPISLSLLALGGLLLRRRS